MWHASRLFGSRRAAKGARAPRRTPRNPLGLQQLERRQLLNADPNDGYIKIDLSNLDQTGVTPAYDIYIQGSANASGQILQYDPTLVTPEGTGGLVFTTPLPSPVTFTSKEYTPVTGDLNSITLATAATLFAGGSVRFSDGSTSTIASISANVTAGSWAPPASPGPGGTWNPAPSAQWTVGNDVTIQGGSVASGTLSGTTLTGANGPAVSNSGMSIGSLVVGTKNPGASQTYFFPNDGNGLPFPPSSGQPAQVNQIRAGSSLTVDAMFSDTSGQTNLALSPDSLTVFSGGTMSGFATYVGAASQTQIPTSLGGGSVQQVTVGSLLSTSQVKPTDLSGFNPESTAAQGNQPIPHSFLAVSGVAGTSPIYGVDSFTITFTDPVPANASVTFETTVAATATSATTFTIDAGSGGVPGVIAGLSLGVQPTLSQTDQSTSALSITELAIDSHNIITVTLSGDMPWSFGEMHIDLPPTGGFLPTTKWSATDAKANTIWARQTSAGSASDDKISINGSRIFFSLVQSDDQPPQMAYAQSGGGLSVTQFNPEDIWAGTVPLSQYLELTADALSGGPGNGDGAVFLDLSAVDGFFFPAALSTTVNGKNIVIGQASGTYVPPTTVTGPTTYSAVSRQEILNAYDTFFGSSNPLFDTGAAALRQAYAALHVQSGGTSIGLQNPTFIDWSTPSSPAATALNAAWDNDLNALFTASSKQVDLLGDKNSTAWSVVNAIQVASQGRGYAVGDVITFTAPSSGGRTATARVTQVQPSTATNPGGIVSVEITDPGAYPSSQSNPTVVSISGSGQGATLTVAAMVPAATFYKGTPTAGTGGDPNKLVLTEYVGPSAISDGRYAPPANFSYANLYATGAVFTVFDPRTVPASEAQAFNPGTNGGQPTPMAVGQQILGNFGVFASTTLNTTGPNPNYTFTGTDPWSSGDALAQLDALQRDIVWALNQGNGGILRASTAQPQPGSTTGYWTDEENWYPYPHISGGQYQAQTPQNLFAQWVHTAGSAGGPAIGQDRYFATFPFGNVAGTVPQQDYGQPTRAWGPSGAGTGPLMNQTYGFAYDESPAHGIAGANVPSKFLAIPNTAGNTLTFQLVFGPWDTPAPTSPTVTAIDTASRQDDQPTTAATVTWTVTFSQPVSGVTAANFTLEPATTLSGCSITEVKPSSSSGTSQTWTVTATTGTGYGRLGLDMTSTGGVKNAQDAPLHLAPNPWVGQRYDVDRGAVATLTIPGDAQNPTDAATVVFAVAFTEAVTGLTTANFAAVQAGGVSGATVQTVVGSGTAWTVTVATGSGSGTLGLTLANDTGLIPSVKVPVSSSQVYTIDKHTPAVTPEISAIDRVSANPTSAASVSWTVSFSEPVTGVAAENFTLVPGGGLGGAAAITTITPASTASTATWTVTASGYTGSGTLGLNLTTATGIKDAEDQPLANVPPVFVGASFTIDRTAPAVTAINRTSAEQTDRPTVSWLVNFSKPVSGVSRQNFQLLVGGNLKNTGITNVSGSGTIWTVTAKTGSGSGTLTLDMVNVTGITDAVELPPTGVPFVGQQYEVDRKTAPIDFAPTAFWATVGQASPLIWPRGLIPFVDDGSVQLDVTLAVTGEGALQAASTAGVTVAGSGSKELTFTGTVTALDAYFRQTGRMTYTPASSSLDPRFVTLSSQGSDGLTGGTTSTILVKGATQPSPAPAVTAAGQLGPVKVGRPLEISYAQLAAATGATPTTDRSLQFMLSALQSGRLEVQQNGEWHPVLTPSLFVPSPPLLAPGGLIRWTPATATPGTIDAFQVKVFDGSRYSAASQVQITTVDSYQGVVWDAGAFFVTATNASRRVLDVSARSQPVNLSVDLAAAAYLIDGIENPTIEVSRGQTYLFDLNVPGEPFTLQTVGGGYDPTFIYNEGFAGNGETSGQFAWVVPETGPEELFYQSASTPEFGGKIIVGRLPLD